MRIPPRLRACWQGIDHALRSPRPPLRRLAPWLAALTAVIVLIVWVALSKDGNQNRPRERQYRTTTACLLTDDRGLTSEPAAAAWAGMQQASLDTRIKVQYLSVTGPQTQENALPYYNTLGLRRCTVIIAAGAAPVAAMVTGAQQFRDSQHVVIGNPAPGASDLVRVEADSPDTVQRRIRDIVAHAAKG